MLEGKETLKNYIALGSTNDRESNIGKTRYYLYDLITKKIEHYNLRELKSRIVREKHTPQSRAEIYSAILSEYRNVGEFNPNNIFGLGCHYFEDKPLVYTGDYVFFEGKRWDNDAFYEYKKRIASTSPNLSQPSFKVDMENPLSVHEASSLLELYKKLPWEKPIYADLLAGWMVYSLINGAFKDKVHLIVTCPTINEVEGLIKGVIGDFLYPINTPKKKIINQLINAPYLDKLPILIKRPRDNVWELIKMSKLLFTTSFCIISSQKHIDIFEKGGMGEAHTEPGWVTHTALKLKSLPEAENFYAHCEMLRERKFPERLIARLISMIPIILKNKETIYLYLEKEARTSNGFPRHHRELKYYSTLLAGQHALTNDKLISREKCSDFKMLLYGK